MAASAIHAPRLSFQALATKVRIAAAASAPRAPREPVRIQAHASRGIASTTCVA